MQTFSSPTRPGYKTSCMGDHTRKPRVIASCHFCNMQGYGEEQDLFKFSSYIFSSKEGFADSSYFPLVPQSAYLWY